MALSLDEWKMAKDDLGRIREGCGHTQTHIARIAGVSPGLICRIEAGEEKPSERILSAYAKECCLGFDELMHQWRKTPAEITLAIRENPDLWHMVRRELSIQS